MAKRRLPMQTLTILVAGILTAFVSGAPETVRAEGAADAPAAAVEATIPDSSEVVAAPPTDPADDPWLTEQGPPVPVPVEVAQEQVLARWQDPDASIEARAAAVRRVRLELGLGDLMAPAMSLVRAASEEDPQIQTALARDLAPGVPSIQMAHAVAVWKSGDIGAATHAFVEALWTAMTHVEVQIWFVENLALILLVVVLGSSFAFMVLACAMVFPHAAHDLGDLFSSRMPAFARTAALAGLLFVPFVLGEGIVGFALALFTVAFAYGSGRQRNALAMAAVLLVVGLHPTAQLATVTMSLFERDPSLVSVFAVANGTATQADLDRLEAAGPENLAAAHALAYHARRHGLMEEARARLDAIAEHHPDDPVMLANRGNVEMRRGAVEEAIAYYTRSADAEDSATVLFDLSQAYAAAFRMDEVEATLARAQEIDDEEVSALSGAGDATLVADLGIPFGSLQKSLVTLALAQKPQSTVADFLAPGRLGDRWFFTASAFALTALLCLLFAGRFDHSSVCKRCGHRICTRCEDTVWSEDLCEDCHHLFQNPEDTDPSLRMARLQALSKREVRIDRIWTTASLVVPGAAGFGSRRPDLAMFGLLLFAWAATWIVWPTGMLVDPLLLGSVAWIFFALPGGLALLAYVGVVLTSLVARKNL